MSGAQRLQSGERWWCSCGRRQLCHRLFVECTAWAPQARRLWGRIGKDCGWENLRAPAVRRPWEERATGAMLEFLEDTRVGCRASAVAASGPQVRGTGEEREDQGSEGEEGDQPPETVFSFVLDVFCCKTGDWSRRLSFDTV